MAGDWIKMRTNLHEHPKVLMVADTLGVDAFAVVGRLHRLWAWVDQHSESGRAVVAPLSRVDALVCATGFADALRSVGWLAGDDGCLDFPGFEEHNGETAKKRAENSKRQKKRRSEVSRTCRASVAQNARPEKRREEKNKTPPNPPAGDGRKRPGVGEVQPVGRAEIHAVAAELGGVAAKFVDAFPLVCTAAGWTVGSLRDLHATAERLNLPEPDILAVMRRLQAVDRKYPTPKPSEVLEAIRAAYNAKARGVPA